MAPEIDEERRKIRIAIEQAAVEELRKHMAAEDAKDKRITGWHIGKEIPLAVIFFLIVQTSSIIWWAASTSADLVSQRSSLVVALAAQAAVDGKQDNDVQRSEARLTAQLDKLSNKMDRIIERVSK